MSAKWAKAEIDLVVSPIAILVADPARHPRLAPGLNEVGAGSAVYNAAAGTVGTRSRTKRHGQVGVRPRSPFSNRHTDTRTHIYLWDNPQMRRGFIICCFPWPVGHAVLHARAGFKPVETGLRCKSQFGGDIPYLAAQIKVSAEFAFF